MNKIRYAIEQNLRGKAWIDALELSPEIEKRSDLYRYQPPSDFEVSVIGMINGWQVADELRFVGAI